MAKHPTLRVRLHVSKAKGFCRLKAHVCKGKEVSRKYILSDIAAPGSELAKFTPEGVLKPGEQTSYYLKMDVSLFYAVAKEVAEEAEGSGTLATIPSKQLTERARELFYNATPRVELMPRVC